MKPRGGAMAPSGALALLEESFHLLRQSPAALACYLVGTAPYVLALVWFVSDMAHHPEAPRRCALLAGVVALLFPWCKTWQTASVTLLRATFTGLPPQPWNARRIWNCLVTQSTWQAPALLVLPGAAFLVFPLPWAVAWFQNLTVLGDASEGRLGENAARAWKQTWLWPAQNVLLILILAMLAFAVTINLAAALLAVPFLLKSLLGVDTHVTLSVASTLNTTFLTLVLGLAWLCIDPLAKAAYLLRCFHGESLVTGEDLRVVLRRAGAGRPALKALVCVLLLGLVALPGSSALAASPPPDPLDQALDEVLARPEFAWRAGPDVESLDEEPDTMLQRWLDEIRELTVQVGRQLRDWIARFFDWIERLFRGRGRPAGPSTPWLDWLASPGILMAAAIIAVVGVVFWLAWTLAGRKAVPSGVAHAMASVPDVADEAVVADQLPEDAWRKMADDLLRKGEVRLALRALYLASLAHLAAHNLVQIARFKSNREYLDEVRRRARDRAETITAFEHLVMAFERVWYGIHPPTAELWDAVEADIRRIRA